jgi:hypothetical protein
MSGVPTKFEGFWRQSVDEASNLPWPTAVNEWSGRQEFLASLVALETVAEIVHAAGISRCRVCGQRNGSGQYTHDDWTWPEGFRHYVADHAVQPSSGFIAFVAAVSR